MQLTLSSVCDQDQSLASRRAADPCRLDYWAHLPLRYSQHASERCVERGIPTLPYLPFDSRLADTDLGPGGVDAVVFKIPAEADPFFVVLSPDGSVLTTFRKDGEWTAWRANKDRRRRKGLIV